MLEAVKQKDAKAKHTLKKYGDQNLKTKHANLVLYKHEKETKSNPLFSPFIYEIIDVNRSMITAYSLNRIAHKTNQI